METVKEILKGKGNQVWFTTPDSSVYEALVKMAMNEVGALVVLEGEKLVGMFSERDYARKVILRGKTSRETSVRDVMSHPVITVDPSQTIDECMRIMTVRRIRHLPVLDGGVLVGLISIGDVVRSIITDQQSTIVQLEDYIVGRR